MQSQRSSTSKKLCRYCVNLSEIPDIWLSGLKSKEQIRGILSHPQATGLRWWHPWKGGNSKITIFRIDRYMYCQTDSLCRGNWPCWVKICFRAKLTSSQSFWLFFAANFENCQDQVGQIIVQMNELELPAHQDIYFQFLKSRLPIFNSAICKKRMFALENNMINNAFFKSSNFNVGNLQLQTKNMLKPNKHRNLCLFFNNCNQNTLGFDSFH